jgi:hypothetical protein
MNNSIHNEIRITDINKGIIAIDMTDLDFFTVTLNADKLGYISIGNLKKQLEAYGYKIVSTSN